MHTGIMHTTPIYTNPINTDKTDIDIAPSNFFLRLYKGIAIMYTKHPALEAVCMDRVPWGKNNGGRGRVS